MTGPAGILIYVNFIVALIFMDKTINFVLISTTKRSSSDVNTSHPEKENYVKRGIIKERR